MAVEGTVLSAKFDDEGGEAAIVSVKYCYKDEESFTPASASLALTGTPVGNGSFIVQFFTSVPFEFTDADSLADIHGRVADYVNENWDKIDAVADGSGVVFTYNVESFELNGTELEASMVDAQGLSISSTAFSGGTATLPQGQLLMFVDGSSTEINMDASYVAAANTHRAAFALASTREDLDLPTPAATIVDKDPEGNVRQAQVFFEV